MKNSDDLITFAGDDGPICILKNDGTVKWERPGEIDEAALMFSEAITLGAEYKVGITKNHRKRMIADIYEELLGIANNHDGKISKEQLTTAMEERMLVHKLQGI